jgi:branched-chain amino acid transport system substrate-binding protein
MNQKKYRWLIIGVIIIVLIVITIIFMQKSREDAVKVGFIGPLTGASAVYGQWEKNGLELALSEINSDKSIDGKNLEIIYEDSGGDTTRAISAAQKLIDSDKVSIIFGGLSNEVLGVAPIAEKNKVILFSPAAGSEKIRQAGDYVFRNRESGEIHGKAMAEFVYNLGFKKAAVIFANADNGISYKNGFVNKYKELGGEIAYEESYTKGELDYKTILLKMQSKYPEAVYLPGYGNDIGLILKQAKELKMDYRFFSVPGIEVPELFNISGNASENIIYSLSVFDPKNPEIINYTQSYKEKYGEESEFIAANSYDGLKIIANAIKFCNGDKNTSCIRDYLYGLKDYAGVGGLTSFDSDGEVIKPVLFKVIRNGQFIKYED